MVGNRDKGHSSVTSVERPRRQHGSYLSCGDFPGRGSRCLVRLGHQLSGPGCRSVLGARTAGQNPHSYTTRCAARSPSCAPPASSSTPRGTCPGTATGPRTSPQAPADGRATPPSPRSAAACLRDSDRDVRFAIPDASGSTRKRVLLPIRCRRRNCTERRQPSQRSRGAHLNAPDCQPRSASQWPRQTATWRTPRPANWRNPRWWCSSTSASHRRRSSARTGRTSTSPTTTSRLSKDAAMHALYTIAHAKASAFRYFASISRLRLACNSPAIMNGFRQPCMCPAVGRSADADDLDVDGQGGPNAIRGEGWTALQICSCKACAVAQPQAVAAGQGTVPSAHQRTFAIKWQYLYGDLVEGQSDFRVGPTVRMQARSNLSGIHCRHGCPCSSGHLQRRPCRTR